MTDRTTHADRRVVQRECPRFPLIAAALVTCLVMSAASAQTPGPPSVARRIDVPGIRQFPLPSDPTLQEECEAALAAMRALAHPSDADFAAVDARIHELGVCLVDASEASVSRRLNIEWGMELVSRRGRALDAFMAFDRAARTLANDPSDEDGARLASGYGDAFRLLARHDESLSEYDGAMRAFERLQNKEGMAQAVRGRGHTLMSLGCYEEALAEYETGARLLEGCGDELGSARFVADRGTALLALGRHVEGLAEFDRASKVLERLGDDRYMAGLALNVARALMSQSRDDDALAEFDTAERLCQRLGNEALLAVVMQCRGICYAAQSQHDRAIAEYDKALRTLEKTGDRQRLAEVFQNRANSRTSLSRYDDALSDLDQAAQMFTRSGAERRLAGICLSRGNLFSRLSRFAQALVAFDTGAKIAAKYNDEARRGMLLAARAGALIPLGRYEELLGDFDKVAALLQRFGDDESLSVLFTNRGVACARLSRFEEALASFERAERLLGKNARSGQLAAIRVNRGGVLYSLSRHEEALAEYDNARQVFKRLGNDRQLAMISVNCAEIFRVTDREELALLELNTAAALYEELRDEAGIASVAATRGALFRSLARYDEALAELEAAARSYERLGNLEPLASIAGSRAIVFRALSRHDEALCELEKAQEIREKLGQDGELAGIAHIRGYVFQAQGRHADALREFSHAAVRVESMLQSQVQRLGNETSSVFRERFYDIVERALRSAASIPGLTDAQRNAAYKVFGTFVGLGTAEMIAERAGPELDFTPPQRVRLQQVAVESRQLVARRDQIAAARGKDISGGAHTLSDELRPVVAQLHELEYEGSRIVDEARSRQQVYAGIQYPKAASVDEVQSELDLGVALLEYALDNGHIFAFVTTRSTQRLVGLGGVADVLQDVQQLCSTMTPDVRPSPSVLWLRRLGQRLLDPLLATLDGDPEITTLLIAANGDLARIPFEILLVLEGRAGTQSAAEVMLLNRYDMAYVHSGTVMRAMKLDARRRTTREGLEFIGLGFPVDADAESVADRPKAVLAAARRFERRPLPNSGLEVLEIARLFARDELSVASIGRAVAELDGGPAETGARHVGGDHFELFLRGGATEEVLKTDPRVRTARVLHLACHGEADLDTPALSRLILARPSATNTRSGEDGYVYVRELRDLKISAELLVLSACSTNAGKLHPMEGITGLSRAGLAAGAESVISTFWPVDDRAAQELMLDFYRRWQGGMTRIAALCAAKRKAIERGVPLKTWSAYALWDAATR